MMRHLSYALAILLLTGSVCQAVDPAVLEAQKERIEVIEKVAPSVVAIFGAGGGGGGSGVLISPEGYALTNFHVTKGAGDFMKCGLNNGVLYDGVIVSIDPTGDVALVKLLGRDDFPYSPLGDSDKVKVGDWTYAMGNPFLLATDYRPTVTYGIVSGVHRYQEPAANNFLEYTDCIQIDTSINPGNSGGPLFNEQGEVVGINGRGSFEKRGRVNSGAGYAISSNQIKHFLDHLRSGRILDHATLGATLATQSDGSLTVAEILEESDAYRRGLRYGDEIVSFGGRSIRSVNQFKNILGIYPKGWKVPLVYRRGGDKFTIFPRLRALHRKSDFTSGPPKPPEAEPPKDGEKPKPTPIRLPKPAAAAPAKYKHMLVKKDGYANYYFNEQAQKPLFDSLSKWGDFKKAGGEWVLTGNDAADKPFELTLNDTAVTLVHDGKTTIQNVAKGDYGDTPVGSGGLLAALHQFRLLMTKGRDGFTDCYYLGSEPLSVDGKKVDVLITVKITTECRWYFDRETRELIGFDSFLTEDVDPCEIRFGELQDLNGYKLPATLQVTSSEAEIVTLNIETAKLAPEVK